MTTLAEVEQRLSAIADEYPQSLRQAAHRDVKRHGWHIYEVLSRKPEPGTIADLGGGMGPFSVGCAAYGWQAMVIDDLQDDANRIHGNDVFNVHARYGIEIINRDVIADGVDLAPASLDVVTTFDSMEHWHNSPKRLFASVMDALKPGGMFFLGVPNNVNLRKRVMVPFGVGHWSPLKEWYEPEVFRGHVREPSVNDLKWIANDMGLVNIEILGRNWLGYKSRFSPVQVITPFVDRFLWRFPSLCSDIYVIGTKPE